MVLGIISVVTGLLFVGVVFGIIAIILFIVARKGNDKSGIGIAGLVTGIVGTVISLFMIVFLCIGMSMVDDVSSSDVIATDVGDSLDGANSLDSFLPADVTADLIEGEWSLDTVYVPDEQDGWQGDCSLTYSQAKDLEAAGSDATITLDSDGTYVLSFDKVEAMGTWTIDEYFIELDPEKSSNTIYAYYYDFDGDEEIMLVDGALVMDFVR